MDKQFVSLLSEEDLEKLIMKCLVRFEEMKISKNLVDENYSINEVAKKLGRAHDTIKKMVRDGTLKATADGRRITAVSLKEYLQNDSQK